MYLNLPILKKLESLHRGGITFEFKPGSRISRGFADLGYEEFILLGNRRIMSLFSGDQKDFTDSDSGHFFYIPTVDELLDKCYELRIKPETEAIESNNIHIKLSSQDNTVQVSSSANTLFEALLDALLQICGVATAALPRKLKIEKPQI